MPSVISDSIQRAYRISGILKSDAGRLISGSQMKEGLDAANRMVQAWILENLLIWADVGVSVPMLPNVAFYDIGTDVSTPPYNVTPPAIFAPRPTGLNNVSLVYNNQTPFNEIPLIPQTRFEWDLLPIKTLTSSIPAYYYYQALVPCGRLFIWPIPTAQWILTVYLPQQLQGFVNSTDTLIWPPGYEEAFETNLAVRLAQQFPERAALSNDTRALAATLKMNIKAVNVQPMHIYPESATLGANRNNVLPRWNIKINGFMGGPA